MRFLLIILISFIQACGTSQKTTTVTSRAEKVAAIQTLNETIKPMPNASVTTSIDIDWPAGILPWDRYTLPVISPNGLHAATQLGQPPSIQTLSGNNNQAIGTTTIELHLLDPLRGQVTQPLLIDRKGLILSRASNDSVVLVEYPNGPDRRWIGQLDWKTGELHWLASDNSINAFPSVNMYNEVAWSRRTTEENRFHLVIKTTQRQQIIDDGKSDWLFPVFLGEDRLRVFRIIEGQLSLVELDLLARDPLLTAISLPIVESGASRELVWQIATTNQASSWHRAHAFYHPIRKRMVIWQPDQPFETVALLEGSVASTPVHDGSWLVASQNRIVRQNIGEEDGIHIRNHLVIPFATTSNKWTHLLLIPQSNRFEVRAINLSK